MLVFLVLKNAVECTSQRLKWTSGARVMDNIEAATIVKRCPNFPERTHRNTRLTGMGKILEVSMSS